MNQETRMVATQWNHLPPIDEIGVLSDKDRACLDAIRSVLDEHGCLDRFGVNLLHRHFELADDEILVEQVDDAGRKLVVKPVRLSVVAADMPTAYETQWHWRRSPSGEVAQICVQRCFPGSYESPAHVHKHVGW
jgi:hypothetical protein